LIIQFLLLLLLLLFLLLLLLLVDRSMFEISILNLNSPGDDLT
jgi:hypothetical protein